MCLRILRQSRKNDSRKFALRIPCATVTHSTLRQDIDLVVLDDRGSLDERDNAADLILYVFAPFTDAHHLFFAIPQRKSDDLARLRVTHEHPPTEARLPLSGGQDDLQQDARDVLKAPFPGQKCDVAGVHHFPLRCASFLTLLSNHAAMNPR
jgi:hypothetical protein